MQHSAAWRRFPVQLRAVPVSGALDCFCTLPKPTVELVERAFGDEKPPIVVLEISSDSAESPFQCFIAWSGLDTNSVPSITDKSLDVGISAQFMRNLGVPEGELLNVQPVFATPVARQVFVVPHSVDDSEIVEHNALELEENLLRQLRCAYPGMVCPVHIRRGLHAVIRVERVVVPAGAELAWQHCPKDASGAPVEVVTLGEGTELVVATRMRKQEEGEQPEALSLRITAVEAASGLAVRVHPQTLASARRPKDRSEAPVITMTQMCDVAWSAKQAKQKDGSKKGAEGVSVAVERGTLPPSELRRAVRVVQIIGDPSVPAHCARLQGPFARAKAGGILIVDNGLVEEGDGNQLSDADPQAAAPASGAASNAAEQAKTVHADPWKKAVQSLQFHGCSPAAGAAFQGGGPAAAAIDAKRHGVLVTGGSGYGKTIFLEALAEQCPAYTVLVRGQELAAKEDKKGASTAALNALRKAATEAAANAPSVLLIDDIDALMPAPGEQGHDPNAAMLVSQFSALANRFASASGHGGELCGAAGPLCSGVTVVATAKSAERVHPEVLHHAALFPDRVTLSLPDGKQRRQALCLQLAERHADAPSAAVAQVARKTDNYTPQDLATVVSKAVHHGALRSRCCPGQGRVSLVWEDFESSLGDFKPAALHGISMFKPQELSWDDMGGLEDVKKCIMETIVLPTKYPELFSKVPVKLRSGVLLYGPPGCGKSHVVACAVAEAKLNCIQVSGPELLNKYIGASEQRVREVFEQAAAAAPSILFFDEFDSIAPQRGHDNTGVTDRVVNQLLCQLDGVEGRSGVYVIAATSRPDLIDAALLRPGRLDRSALCGMPDAAERSKILKALARKLNVAEDINWDALAERTDGYSSADLGAVLSTARLQSVQRVVDTASELAKMNVGDDAAAEGESRRAAAWAAARASDEGGALPSAVMRELEPELDAVADVVGSAAAAAAPGAAAEVAASVPVITEAALIDALQQTRSSITPSERVRWEALYAKFQQSRGGAAEQKRPQQRVTAA
eukprot:TRINITY_DN5044_c0_g1_i1.p1 TRINITY_DN5044_c0_g1~~TRINITY_DN5044_c0_g1_i1.p1  ORF type:complete len:1058 (+),score=384.46 TRINITY_DN5044_c0_g1_i1:105-3176(+)